MILKFLHDAAVSVAETTYLVVSLRPSSETALVGTGFGDRF
jgi:hypothetical protein